MVALQTSPKIESLYGLGLWVERQQNDKGLHGIFATFARLPLGQFSA